MDKTIAFIRKVGSQFCVFSESGKKLGCYKTREAATKRLRQIEFFKHKGKSDMSENTPFEDKFEEAMTQFASKLDPDPASRTEDYSKEPPKKLKKGKQLPKDPAGGPTKTDLAGGSLAGIVTELVIDNKLHLPIRDENEAKSSILRLTYFDGIPKWFNGTEAELKQFVLSAVAIKYPDLKVNINVPAEAALAIAAQKGKSEVQVKDPIKETGLPKHVPDIPTPSFSETSKKYVKDIFAAIQEGVSVKVLAAHLKDTLDKRKSELKDALKMADRLENDGLTGEEFCSLISFLQEDILRELLMKSTMANRRQAILNKVIEKRKNG